ncbi:MAG: SAM-dependent chlorinase/fluorinase [Nitrospirae bacterium]|nr:SAM-dependent chlorinase/fluorinase [Nitrospirota bacterium]
MLERPVITLTTDYGQKDPFAGMIKGVILGINPRAEIVDLTHNIGRHNIYEAALVLGMSFKYFPSAAVHIAVVDPGVGGERRPILVVTENHCFVGPDNGIFSLIFEMESGKFLRVYHITSSQYFLPVTGSTFHGRDIFAPVAAWLSTGVDSLKFGEPVTDYVTITLPRPFFSGGNVIRGEVVLIDNFGNAVTNISAEDLSRMSPAGPGQGFIVRYGDLDVSFFGCYSDAPDRSLSATIDGFGRVELFVKLDNAARMFNIGAGDRVIVTTVN